MKSLVVKPVPVPASSHHPPAPGDDVLPRHEFTYVLLKLELESLPLKDLVKLQSLPTC